jgi:hypothetical protein
VNDKQPNEESLQDEFRTLGRNLVEAMRAAWQAPESKRLRDDVVTGLADLGSVLRREADNLASSEAARQVKGNVEQVGEKLRAPEVRAKVQNELLGALRTVNNELQKVIDHWGEEPGRTGQGAETYPAPASPSMGGEAVPDVSKPEILAEDPFGTNVRPEGAAAEPTPHTPMGSETVWTEPTRPQEDDPFAQSLPPQDPEEGSGG